MRCITHKMNGYVCEVCGMTARQIAQQPCDHPPACYELDDNGRSSCRWCEQNAGYELANNALRAQLRKLSIVVKEGATLNLTVPAVGYMEVCEGGTVVMRGVPAPVTECRPESERKPTAEGIRRYPEAPVGYYTDDHFDRESWRPCTCTPDCPASCKGACGCDACSTAYSDFLSSRGE